MKIREGTDNDFDQITVLQQAIYPTWPMSADHFHTIDRFHHAFPRYRLRRWVALEGQQVIGYAEYRQTPWYYAPHHFDIRLHVHPAWHGIGVGRSLYEHLMASMEHLAAHRFGAATSDDQPRGLRFLQDRGFVEVRRMQTSWLQLDQFDEPSADPAPALLRTYADLADDPACARKLHALHMATMADQTDFTPPTFDEWHHLIVESPLFLPDATVIALHEDRYVGLSLMVADHSPEAVRASFTAVHGEYRGQGLAVAMKLAAIKWAQQHGKRILKSSSTNDVINHINRQLGFEPHSWWIHFLRPVNR